MNPTFSLLLVSIKVHRVFHLTGLLVHAKRQPPSEPPCWIKRHETPRLFNGALVFILGLWAQVMLLPYGCSMNWRVRVCRYTHAQTRNWFANYQLLHLKINKEVQYLLRHPAEQWEKKINKKIKAQNWQENCPEVISEVFKLSWKTSCNLPHRKKQKTKAPLCFLKNVRVQHTHSLTRSLNIGSETHSGICLGTMGVYSLIQRGAGMHKGCCRLKNMVFGPVWIITAWFG